MKLRQIKKVFSKSKEGRTISKREERKFLLHVNRILGRWEPFDYLAVPLVKTIPESIDLLLTIKSEHPIYFESPNISRSVRKKVKLTLKRNIRDDSKLLASFR